MFKSELKKYLEQLKESCPLKGATLLDFAPIDWNACSLHDDRSLLECQ